MTVDVSKQLDRAKRFLEKSRIEDAIEAYQSILNESPGHPESLQALGDLYTRQGQLDRAAHTTACCSIDCASSAKRTRPRRFTRALKRVQQPAERMARYAILLQKQNRSDEAIEQLTQASELFLARGREEPALDCLERAAQLDPDNAARQFAVGELAERAGRTRRRRGPFCGRRSLPRLPATPNPRSNCWRALMHLSPRAQPGAALFAGAVAARRCGGSGEALEPWTASEPDAAR